MTKIVNEDSFTIGRSLDCTLPLTEDSISRVHVVVHRRQDQIWIEDKGSSNGTFVNNVRIAPNSLVNVVSSDRIRVGKSDYVLTISLELQENEEDDQKPIPNSDATDLLPSTQANPASVVLVPVEKAAKHNIRRDTRPTPKEGGKVEIPGGYNNNHPQFEGERILHEAHKKAAQIIYDGEVQAEKRAQAIYLDARERKSQADAYYQNKIQQAHLEADRIIQSFQKQGQELLEQARKFAQEIRDEVDVVTANLKDEARRDAATISRVAREEAEAIGKAAREEAEALEKEAREETEALGRETARLSKDAREEAARIGREAREEAAMIVREAREDAATIAREAREEAEILKHEAYEKARTKAEIEAEDLVVSAKAESRDILDEANKQASEMLMKARDEMESELQDLKNLLEEKRKQMQVFKKEQEELTIKALGETEELEGQLFELKSEYATYREQLEAAQRELGEVRVEDNALREKIRDQRKTTAELEHQVGTLYGDSKTLERKNKDLQEQLGHFALDIQAAEDQKRMIENELNQQKAVVKERLEKEHQRLLKDSEARLQDAQLELNKRFQKLEREMLEEILGRKEELVKDILIVIETRIAKVLEPAKWDQVSGIIFQGISETIEGKAVTFNGDSKAPKESASLQRKRNKENMRWVGVGLAVGIAVSILSVQTYSRIKSDKTPMRTLAAEETKRRKADLERRKFNPVQVKDVKETYTDSVIYTSDFVAAYSNPEYQQKLYKAASAYLLKTWRVDEDQSIQVLSMSNALIKELNDKKLSIHPDFIKDGIAKMRSLEKDSLNRMKDVLGSEVRLESYRRFERNFFETEIRNKK